MTNRIRTLVVLGAVLMVRLSIGCGSAAPTVAVSKVAAPDSPEFLAAQEDANRFAEQRKQEEAKQRSRRRLPQVD